MSFIYVPALTTVGQVTRTANGSIAAGSPCIIDAAGTVSQVKITPGGTNVTFPGNDFLFGTGTVLNLASIVYQPVENVVVIFFRTSSGITAVAASVTGANITYGVATVVTSGNTEAPSCCYDSTADKIIIGYVENALADRLESKVITVSGLTISAGVAGFGTLDLGSGGDVQTCSYDPVADKTVFGVIDDTLTRVTAYLGTVSGTTITIGPSVTVSAAGSLCVRSCYDSTNNVTIFAYNDKSGTPDGFAAVGTIAAGAITFGTPVTFETNAVAAADSITIAHDQQYGYDLIVYENTNTSIVNAIVGTVSGTSISFGAKYTSNTIIATGSLSWQTTGQNFFFNNRQTSTINDSRIITVNSIGAVTYGTETSQTFTNATTVIRSAYIGGYDNFCVYYDATSDEIIGDIATIGTSNLTATNFIGFANGTYVSGSPATINTIGSSNTNQTGLTTAGAYYVWRDGTINLTPDSPSVYAGISDSATSIIVKG